MTHGSLVTAYFAPRLGENVCGPILLKLFPNWDRDDIKQTATCSFIPLCVSPLDIPGLAGVRAVEVVQQPNAGGGSRGVPLHPGAVHAAAHSAAPAAAALLLHQLLSGHAPRGDPPHRRCGLIPCKRSAPNSLLN